MVLPVIKQTMSKFFIDSKSEGHLNCFIGSKVTAILLNGWILPPGGVALGRVCPAACTAGLFIDNQARISTCIRILIFGSMGPNKHLVNTSCSVVQS